MVLPNTNKINYTASVLFVMDKHEQIIKEIYTTYSLNEYDNAYMSKESYTMDLILDKTTMRFNEENDYGSRIFFAREDKLIHYWIENIKHVSEIKAYGNVNYFKSCLQYIRNKINGSTIMDTYETIMNKCDDKIIIEI